MFYVSKNCIKNKILIYKFQKKQKKKNVLVIRVCLVLNISLFIFSSLGTFKW